MVKKVFGVSMSSFVVSIKSPCNDNNAILKRSKVAEYKTCRLFICYSQTSIKTSLSGQINLMNYKITHEYTKLAQ